LLEWQRRQFCLRQWRVQVWRQLSNLAEDSGNIPIPPQDVKFRASSLNQDGISSKMTKVIFVV